METLSSDLTFDGVDRTYYLDGKEQNLGELESYDESNKSMHVYENFDKKELDIYIYSYGINKPNEELRFHLSLENDLHYEDRNAQREFNRT
ncbi:hypothetical protein [Lysinibacillus xylanilyticus]|uniref:hypothetical protein n=1 Tax=Lysinibacillus xylanilyticus TaxID=582475 RepID=UPI0038219B22